ncbi:MAG: hypothetical protein P4M09_18090 [Devosia sp.]|nr:hypothetical protein [Devosia sp.]
MTIHAIQSGVPVTFVKRWLGHSRLSTTENYLDAIGVKTAASLRGCGESRHRSG